MAYDYSWKCPWCPTYYSGPYRESVEREREHRASCPARPAMTGDRSPARSPATPATKPSAQEPDLFLPSDKKFVGCQLTGSAFCHTQKYWATAGYQGEICCIPKPCLFLREAEDQK
ncbi:MAG: hypothetical protein PHI12_07455 [Dehalococcoidales bacterium]|nr:hypothetical protein [Dehalococcoidales bacterium]